MPEKQLVGIICKCGEFLPLSEIEPIEPAQLEAVKRKLGLEGWQRLVQHSPHGCNRGMVCTVDDLVLRP